MSSVDGPFGPNRNGGIPDLAAMKAAKQAEEKGMIPWPVALIELQQILIAGLDRMTNELVGLRQILTPTEVRLHIPTLVPATDDDGLFVGYRVFCAQCSDEAAAFVSPCTFKDPDNWPPNMLFSAPYPQSPEKPSQADVQDPSGPS